MLSKSLTLALALPFLAFAPAAEAGSTAQRVAEIVTYRLNDGVSQTDHLAAANATTAFLERTGAVVTRTLSVDETGLWTDFIIWTSLSAAQEAQGQAMQQAEFGAFFSGMDEASVTMRHAPIMMQME